MAENDDSPGDSEHGLSAKQQAAVLACVACRSVGETAKASGISIKTLERWRKLPAFQAALRDAERLVYADGLRTLLADQLVNMTRIMQLREGSEDDAVRLRAALGLEAALARRFSGLAIEEIESRLTTLEQASNL